MVLGLLDQLLIFSQLYLIELLGLLTGLGLLELWHLIYPRLLTGFGMLVFFTNLSLMEFQVRYLALFLLFSVIDAGSPFNYRFFLNKFPACFNLFVFCFLVTPCLVVAVQPCIEWIQIRKKKQVVGIAISWSWCWLPVTLV